jgi:hypothetical protein
MTDGPDAEEQQDDASEEGLTVLQLMGSVLAAAFGVQSSRNRQRDFSRGKPGQFIIVGIILTAVFVLTIAGVVSLVLRSVG